MNIGKLNLLEHIDGELEYFSTSHDLNEEQFQELKDFFEHIKTYLETL